MCKLENTIPIVGVVGMGYFPDGKEFVFIPRVKNVPAMRSPSAEALAKTLKKVFADERLSVLPSHDEMAFGMKVYKLNRQDEAEFVSAYNLA